MNLPDTGFVVLKGEVNTLSLTSNPLFNPYSHSSIACRPITAPSG